MGMIVVVIVPMVMMVVIMVMVVIMAMMVVMMVMIVVVIAVRPTNMPVLVFAFGGAEQLLDRDRLLLDLGQLEGEVDDLVLKDRGAQLHLGAGIILVELHHLALAAGEVARALHDGALHLLIRHRDRIAL